MNTGIVLSDLHLFSRRSEGESLFASFHEQIGVVDTLVLNGDIFDFRWSCLPNEAATVAAAIQWLSNLLQRFPDHRIYYLLGNHDCIAAFTKRLSTFAARNPRLESHESHLQLGSNLFLHGDCAVKKMSPSAFARYRASWRNDRQRGHVSKALYDASDSLGISQKVHDLYFPEGRTVKRIAYSLDHLLPGWRDTIDHCYFGHTHLPFQGHWHDGVQFHNTGSAIRSMGFRPQNFSYHSL